MNGNHYSYSYQFETQDYKTLDYEEDSECVKETTPELIEDSTHQDSPVNRELVPKLPLSEQSSSQQSLHEQSNSSKPSKQSQSTKSSKQINYSKSSKDTSSFTVRIPIPPKSFFVSVGIIVLLLLLIECVIAISAAVYPNVTHRVRSKKDFDKLRDSVRFIRFPSDSCNEETFTDLSFSRFTALESVIIEDNCLRYVTSVEVSNLNHLKSIQIGRNAFSTLNSPSVLAMPLSVDKKGLFIKNCSSLNSIEIAPYSFSGYNFFSIESTFVMSC